MPSEVGSIVHPWYKGIHEWQVQAKAELGRPIDYIDPDQGHVVYHPKALRLRSEKGDEVLWFPYWMSTVKTKGKVKWGQRPPVLEERVFLELMENGVAGGVFSQDLVTKLAMICQQHEKKE